MSKFDRKRFKSGVKESIEYSNRTKDSRGIGPKQPIDWDALEAVGYVRYTPSDKKSNYVSIIPYFPGDKDPRQGNIKQSARQVTHFLEFWTHRIESTGDIFVCPHETFKEPCPMCEYIQTQRGKLDKEAWMKVRPIR